MPKLKIKITQATTSDNETFLIHQFEDGNNHSSFEIYQLVKNSTEVAEKFGISKINENGKEENTRTMCEKMVRKIESMKS